MTAYAMVSTAGNDFAHRIPIHHARKILHKGSWAKSLCGIYPSRRLGWINAPAGRECPSCRARHDILSKPTRPKKLATGHKSRLWNAKSAWRNMTPEQRSEYLKWVVEVSGDGAYKLEQRDQYTELSIGTVFPWVFNEVTKGG